MKINIKKFNKLSDKDKIKLLQNDFKYFLYFVWKFLDLPNPTPVQYDIADFLQRKDTRRMIQAYRGIGKTFITGAYVVWRLWKDPNENFLIVSATGKFAEEIAKFIKKILQQMPLVSHLDPALTTNNSILSFDVNGRTKVNKSPSIKVAGISGQITGSRATEIIVDDVEVEKNSRTQTMRDSIRSGIKEFSNIIVPGGKITYLGTPQTEDTIYKDLSSKGYNVRIWPARYPMIEKVSGYKGCLAPWVEEEVTKKPDLQWKPINSKQHNDNDLTERELDNGKSNFLLQYMLDTELTDAERYPLKTSDLMVFNTPIDKAPISISWASGKQNEIDLPNVGFSGDRWYKPMYVDDIYKEFEGSVMSIDPSGRGSDETAYAIVKILHGFLYVTEVGGIQGGYEDTTLIKLATIAKENKVNAIVVETNFGDGMFEKLLGGILKRVYPVKIEETRSTSQKELRIIDTLEPLMNRHKLIFNQQIIDNDLKQEDTQKQLFYQMTRITKDKGSLKHDDRLDALSIACQYWVESLSVDELYIAEQHRNDLILKEVEDFLSYNSKFISNSNNWFN